MYQSARPRFSGPKADLVSWQWARLALAQEIRKSLDWATQLLAHGQVSVSEALALVQLKTAEAARTHIQQRKRERESAIRMLIRIDSIGETLAERLISEFGSLEAMAEATPGQLQVVDGIGEKRARVIAKEIRKLISQG
ncbi:MAG: hypothetical protein H8D43_01110 [Chloroflexi bacterium]|nr:hypothetical protein [Chloroflexota bacterium]